MHLDLVAGRLLGRYRIHRRVGAGSMGEVYHAHDERLDRPVALKVLNRSAADLRRVEREARAASALNHPHILTVYDVDEQEAVKFISTEFVDGETLRASMQAGPLPAETATSIAAAVADALAAAHAAGVVHRDIKPENIMVRADGWVKVLDFGIAEVGRHAGATLTADQQGLVGTFGYIAPEQVQGARADPASDVYGLGVVLYEMLTGQRPFGDMPVGTYLLALLNEDARPAAELRPDVPAGLSQLLSRMLAREPARRPSAAEVVGELRSSGRVNRSATDGPTAGRAPAGARQNVPQPLTRLLGRDPEAAAIAAMLQHADVRLVTITGPGGIGKTRLAVEVAHRLMPHFADGVCFVPLAGVRDAAMVPAAIGDAMAGVAFDRDRRLLVLDNFEHVLDAAVTLVPLLASHPSLSVLVTSRTSLRLTGEREVPVASLALPGSPGTLSIEEIERVPAVALFAERARAAIPQFAVTRENAEAIVEICRRLDGLPLALELAAARVRLLSPAGLLARLAKRLPLLTGGARDLPERHRTLRDAIAWSEQLLAPPDRRALAVLSVFTGGFAIEAAEAVGGDPAAMLDSMDALTSSSLLRRIELPDGGARFQMLETIREYAADGLDSTADAGVVRERHARYFVEFAATLTAERANDPRRLDAFERDHDNLRAAFDWSIARGDARAALSLVSSLWRFWEARGYVREGVERADAALDLPIGADLRRSRLRALYAAGVLADTAGRYGAARGRFRETLDVARDLRDHWSEASAVNNLAITALREGALAEARRLYEENLDRWRSLGNRTAVALSLLNLGNVLRRQGEPERARGLCEESLAAFDEMADRRGVALASSGLGDVSRQTGDLASAREWFTRALHLHRAMRATRDEAACLLDLACVLRDEGVEFQARQVFEEALATFADLGDAGGIARTFEELARAALLAGDRARALRLAGAAAALRRAMGVELPSDERVRLERDLHGADATPTPESAAWMRDGEAMTVERAIDYAVTGS